MAKPVTWMQLEPATIEPGKTEVSFTFTERDARLIKEGKLCVGAYICAFEVAIDSLVLDKRDSLNVYQGTRKVVRIAARASVLCELIPLQHAVRETRFVVELHDAVSISLGARARVAWFFPDFPDRPLKQAAKTATPSKSHKKVH